MYAEKEDIKVPITHNIDELPKVFMDLAYVDDNGNEITKVSYRTFFSKVFFFVLLVFVFGI